MKKELVVYITEDNKAVIRFPAGLIPDESTCEYVRQILRRLALTEDESKQVKALLVLSLEEDFHG